MLLSLLLVGLIVLPASSGSAAPRVGQRATARNVTQARSQRAVAANPQLADRRSITDVLAKVRHHDDRDDSIAALADVIRRHGGGQVISSARQADEPDEDQALSEDDDDWYTGSWGYAAAVDDVSGDGTGDVLTEHIDLETWHAEIEMRRGNTADVLWSQPMKSEDWLAWAPGRDLTGDGGNDVIAFDLVVTDEEFGGEECYYDEEWDEEWCWYDSYSMEFVWEVTVLAGDTGEPAWLRSFEGSLSESYDETEGPLSVLVDQGGYTYSQSGTNLWVVPFVTDVNGDASTDVVFNAVDLDYTDTGEWTGVHSFVGVDSVSWSARLRSTTRADVLDADGRLLHALTANSPGMLAILYPTPDQPGGADLLWEGSGLTDAEYSCLYAELYVDEIGECDGSGGEESLQLTLLDGATAQQQWTTTYPGWGFSYHAGGDLDGDGADDLVVYTDDWYTGTSGVTFVATRTGETLWSINGDYADVVAVGALDDQAGEDLVTATYTYEEEELPSGWEWETSVVLERRNGATGQVLSTSTRTGSGRETDEGYYEQWPYVVGGGDADGDGMPDLGVGTWTYWENYDDWDDWGSQYSNTAIESGATGQLLYGSDGVPVFLTADLDGDGRVEAVERRTSYEETDDAFVERETWSAINVVSGQRLWTFIGEGDWVWFNAGGADIDGTPGSDVLLHVDELTGNRVHTRITSLSGATGGVRWDFVSRP